MPYLDTVQELIVDAMRHTAILWSIFGLQQIPDTLMELSRELLNVVADYMK